jgi:hypothetical protein
MIWRLVIAAALAVAGATAAQSHDQWSNGDPVPPWVKSACCGPEDIHHLDPSQVHLRDDGYHVDGYPKVVPVKSMIPSPDGDWWIFYRVYSDGSYSSVYCFFGPFSGT